MFHNDSWRTVLFGTRQHLCCVVTTQRVLMLLVEMCSFLTLLNTVTLDSTLRFDRHVLNVAHFHIRALKQTRPCLARHTAISNPRCIFASSLPDWITATARYMVLVNVTWISYGAFLTYLLEW